MFTPTPSYQIVREAILARKNIAAEYKGHSRIMTPHTLGRKQGVEHCLCYQFGGESSSGLSLVPNSPDNWRCVFVSELRDLRVVEGPLHTCTRHTREQSCVDEIDVELTF